MRFKRLALQGWWLGALLLLPGCNALNPLCGSARPSPSLSSISPTTMVFASLPASLTARGGHFVPSSVIVFNGAEIATTVVSSSQLTANITSSMIPAPGQFKVEVKTPSGNSGNLGCSSGGTSGAQTLTVN
jgi:IPT/TIG domain-containing protein